MEEWRAKLNVERKRGTTRVSRNGQVVLPVAARRAVGIESGDLVVTVPVAPGTLLVERVGGEERSPLGKQYRRDDNPLRGVWGSDPDAWLDELRGQWAERRAS